MHFSAQLLSVTLRKENVKCGVRIRSVDTCTSRIEGQNLDTNGIVQLLLRERVRITALVVAVLRDVHASDDVFQQVVLAALQAPHPFRDGDHLTAWAIRTARHRAVDHLRKQRICTLDEAALDALEAHWLAVPAHEPPARVEALEGCLEKLPQQAREVLRLRYEAGLSCGEVATRLHRTTDAVYQTLSRLHRRLRECVETQLERTEHPEEATP